MAAFTLPRPINVTLINVAVSGDKEQHVRTGIEHDPMKEGAVQTNSKAPIFTKKQRKSQDEW